jgi:hypothetical protein
VHPDKDDNGNVRPSNPLTPNSTRFRPDFRSINLTEIPLKFGIVIEGSNHYHGSPFFAVLIAEFFFTKELFSKTEVPI